MTTDSSKDEAVPEAQAVKTVEDDDNVPITVDEVVTRAKNIGHTAKYGMLKPAYRFGRRLFRNAEQAAEAFFEGTRSDKKDSK